MRPGVSPDGTLASAERCTLVDAQTRRTPRRGSTISVVLEPDVTVPEVAITAFPAKTSIAPVTWAALSALLLSRGTKAIGLEGWGGLAAGAGIGAGGGGSELCAAAIRGPAKTSAAKARIPSAARQCRRTRKRYGQKAKPNAVAITYLHFHEV